jgi:hypothetical protein
VGLGASLGISDLKFEIFQRGAKRKPGELLPRAWFGARNRATVF